MPIGPLVRQMLGPLEKPISNIYRGIFIDLETLVQQIHKWTPSASSIFEFGCGEGAVVEILTQTFPLSHITGIDISPRIGRMYQGDTQRVVFKQQDIKDFAAENPASFDLIIINDVMHHIPWDMHEPILEYVKSALKSGGHLILKDWNRNYSPIYFICYFMDRFITGDRVRYKTTLELQDLLRSIFGVESIKSEATIRPWSNNIAFLIQK
ncbi:MAG: class I SAM-dependent methyltransferase [Anaerolineales bacterium]|nr:class I SAM-dependent methyltransferase [Anaerolineales bacterium]MBP6208649.1 class I SAM-dependent methyltransferase [Anaerolineales bacterium]